MKKYFVRKYEAADRQLWNAFVDKSKNGTFLFNRDFMEYHADRFEDFSLLIFENEKLVSLLPANRVGNTLHSHQGLTYGGLVLPKNIRLAESIAVLRTVLEYLNQTQIELLIVKMIPQIYHLVPAFEMDYALFLADAQKYRADTLSVIDLSRPLNATKTRRQGIRRGVKNNLMIREEPNFKSFWEQVLIPNLDAKHGAAPVHTLEEIELLHQKFPQNIRQFNVYHKSQIVAGTTIFVSENVAHPQYISGNCDKNQLGSLDFLYHHLMTEVFAYKRYFDLGTSNASDGRKLNTSLVFWKESFGAHTVTQDFYRVSTANYKLLEDVAL